MGFVWLPILLIILGLAVVGGGVSAYMLSQHTQPQVAVYQEATTPPSVPQTVADTNTPTLISIDAVNAPTLSGTAKGVTKILIGFTVSAPASYTGSKSHGASVVDVTNGHWSYTAPTGFFEPGDYSVDVYAANDLGKATSSDSAAKATFTIATPSAATITYKTITNAALGIFFAVPSSWVIVDHLKDAQQLWAEDPASLGKLSDGYGFSVSIGTTTNSNTAGSRSFVLVQSQQNGYTEDKKRDGCFDSTYTKIKNLTIDNNPAVLFTASGGCDYENNYETLWIHGSTQDWFVSFEDSTYPQKYPYEVPIQQAILNSVHITQ